MVFNYLNVLNLSLFSKKTSRLFHFLYRTHVNLINSTEFISNVTPAEQIKSNFYNLKKLEIKLKKEIINILGNKLYKLELTKLTKENFDKYLKQDWVYFENDEYIDYELQILFKSINDYIYLISRGYFLIKKDLLDFQSELLLK